MELYPSILYTTSLSLFIYMNVWYLISLAKKRNDLADQAWGLGFVFIALIVYYLLKPSGSFLLLLLMIIAWGLRLFLHIHSRHKKGGEDVRYKELVDKTKSSFTQSYLKVFILQGLFLYIIALPIINFGFHNGSLSELGVINYLGLSIWAIGFLCEAIADLQLKRFLEKPENKGKIISSGLWKYSRHPNYFGEISMWWGVFFFTFQSNNIYLWLLSIPSPLLITTLIIFVSGVPMIEKRYSGNKDYQEYAKKTSVLIPWFNKKTK